MIPSLNDILYVNDTTFTTTYGVVIVTLQMGLTRSEEKDRAFESIDPYRYWFVQS